MSQIATPAVTTVSPSLGQRMGWIIAGLCHAVGVRGGKDRAMGPTTILIWRRLQRMAARFDALVARVRGGSQAGAPVRAGPSAPASHPPASDPPAAGAIPQAAAAVRSPHRLPDRLPGGFAWLIRLVPEAAVYNCKVQHFLGDPELAALLAAEPKLGRILRPLCRMLAIRPGPDIPAALYPAKSPPPKPAPRQPAPRQPAPRQPAPRQPAPRQPRSGGRPADPPAGAVSAAVRPAERYD